MGRPKLRDKTQSSTKKVGFFWKNIRGCFKTNVMLVPAFMLSVSCGVTLKTRPSLPGGKKVWTIWSEFWDHNRLPHVTFFMWIFDLKPFPQQRVEATGYDEAVRPKKVSLDF